MLIFLHGKNTYRLLIKLHEIIDQYKTVHKTELDFGYYDDYDLQKIKSSLETSSMFAKKKLIVLKDIINEKIIDYFKKKQLASSKDVIVVVCQTTEVDKRTNIYKFLSKKPVLHQEFQQLNNQQLAVWIKKQVKESGGTVEEDALRKLIIFVGNDMWQLKNEIDKLILYNPKITSNSIDLLTTAKIDTNIFETLDALAQKNKQKALTLLHRHLVQNENAIYILTMIIYQIRNLIKIKSVIENQKTYQGLAQKTKIHPYVIQKSINQLRYFSLLQLKNIYQKLLETEIKIKTGQVDQIVALDMIVAEI